MPTAIQSDSVGIQRPHDQGVGIVDQHLDDGGVAALGRFYQHGGVVLHEKYECKESTVLFLMTYIHPFKASRTENSSTHLEFVEGVGTLLQQYFDHGQMAAGTGQTAHGGHRLLDNYTARRPWDAKIF